MDRQVINDVELSKNIIINKLQNSTIVNVEYFDYDKKEMKCFFRKYGFEFLIIGNRYIYNNSNNILRVLLMNFKKEIETCFMELIELYENNNYLDISNNKVYSIGREHGTKKC